MKRALAVLLDLTLLGALLGLAFTLLGGELRWKTALFRITLTEVDRPLQILALALILRVVSGLDRGLFEALASRRVPVLSALARCVAAFDRGARMLYIAYRARLALSILVLAGSLAALEAYLRYFPETLPPALGNHVASGYHSGLSGIYRYSAALKMDVMRPDYEREMFFNGYRWRHRTDSMGFRNPEERRSAEVVLLGDSMVYGHGLEEAATVRHQLETILGRPVASWGIQGASIHQEYQLLKTFGPVVRPGYAFVFFLANDVDDLSGYLTEEEMQEFLRIPVGDHVTPYRDLTPGPPPRRPGRWELDVEGYLEELYVVRAFGFLWKLVRARGLASAETADGAWEALPLFRGNPRLALAMRVHLRALLKIQDLTATQGIVVVHVFVHTGYIPGEPIYEEILAAFCGRHAIRFLSLRPDFTRAMETRDDLFLPGDGHFSAAGARLAAEVVARYVSDDRRRR